MLHIGSINGEGFCLNGATNCWILGRKADNVFDVKLAKDHSMVVVIGCEALVYCENFIYK